LVAGIVTAAESATECQQRGRQGRKIVERDFDWQCIAQRFKAIYHETIASY
jgi:hypothetical protein